MVTSAGIGGEMVQRSAEQAGEWGAGTGCCLMKETHFASRMSGLLVL